MDDLINKIAQFKVFMSVDLKSAYRQIPLRAKDRLYTACETDTISSVYLHAIWCNQWS